MSIRRITISVQEDVARRLKTAAGEKPVSTWVTEILLEHLDDTELERRWAEFYESVSPSAADVRKAKKLVASLRQPKRRARKSRAA